MRIRVSVDGDPQDFEDLSDLLAADLGEQVSARAGDPVGGAMGMGIDLWVALAAAGSVTALAKTLQIWLKHRRPDVSATITGPDGRTVEVFVSDAEDPEAVLNKVAELAEPAERRGDAADAS
ncbi:hypothetical protein SAMN02982929_03300 [Saccharopolyspora kobensis]|uniref:Uncharacterized protein n=1 Tax=Saccharopolyspora kobensis TaxID=146035 RepID=A0A1H6CBP1_9PSEU|nr:hypothetical protein [Saccharopolyspora kobensis]SEG70419.1 hypothetical protein SAMN02982929_03300 [Saccharopolyspora kobensis]SFC34972.1 hypothetical protein SAMN05216506_101542 [Saccharopolyspora kobensis]